MKDPVFRYTSTLIHYLENLASLRTVIESSRLKLPVRLNLERDLLNHSVHSSTWIEGNTLSLGEVTALANDQKISADERQKLEVMNCIKAIRWMLSNRQHPLNEQRLLKLHRIMIRGLLPNEKSGRYRRVQNYVVNSKRQVIFTPPAPEFVSKRMKELLAWTQNPDLHPVIQSALFHHEFVTIHPFTDGNGRVARAAAQWQLMQKGWDPLYVLGLDDYFAADRTRYYEKIQQTRDLDYDYTYWVEYVAEGLSFAAEAVLKRIRLLGKPRNHISINLTPKQEEMIQLLSRKTMGSSEISKQMKIGRARVHQLVSPLVKAGILEQEGRARAVRYSLKQKNGKF